jgi:hypothetical protein
MTICEALQLTTLIAVVLGSLFYARLKHAEGKAVPTTPERGASALSELRQWSTFLIGIQMGAISIMGFFFEKVRHVDGSSLPLDPRQMTAGVIAVIFFGASILTATWLLGAILSLLIRLKDKTSTENDVYHLSLFRSPDWPKIGPMTGLQYVLFALGIVAFATFVYMRLVTTH